MRAHDDPPSGHKARIHDSKPAVVRDRSLSTDSELSTRTLSNLSTVLDAGGSGAAVVFDVLHKTRDSLAATGVKEPPKHLVEELCCALDGLCAQDLQVSLEDTLWISAPTGIGYQDIYSGPEMTLCIFVLRKGAVLPLHDHPGMHVFGRLLFGRMRVRSYDPAPPVDGLRQAVLHSDMLIGPDPTTYSLGPQEGNVHELMALEDSAFFDILTPSYNPRTGRDCNYYRRQDSADPRHCVLVPVELHNFCMDTFDYMGPRFLRG